ncbi:MAG: hypothetical protein ACTHJQ_01390 [Rhizobiaceae bacterium]
MATSVVQGHIQPIPYGVVMGATGAVAYDLTSAADGAELTGTGDALIVSSDAAGWLHVSDSAASDKAADKKTHRILANVQLTLGAVRKGWFISFLADV